jgi:hypothetical protein
LFLGSVLIAEGVFDDDHGFDDLGGLGVEVDGGAGDACAKEACGEECEEKGFVGDAHALSPRVRVRVQNWGLRIIGLRA